MMMNNIYKRFLNLRTHVRLFIVFFSFPMFLSLEGCASAIFLSQGDKANIRHLHIANEIQMPDEFYYYGPEMGAGIAFGLLGVMATAHKNENGRVYWTKVLKDSGVQVSDIVRKQMHNIVSQRTDFHIDDRDVADVVLKLKITTYGLSIPRGFSGKLQPIIHAEAEMMDGSGKVIWRQGARIHPSHKNAILFTREEYSKDPTILTRAFNQSAMILAEILVDKM